MIPLAPVAVRAIISVFLRRMGPLYDNIIRGRALQYYFAAVSACQDTGLC